MSKIVTLLTPVIRGKKTIKEVELHEPTVLALQGLEIMPIIRGDVAQLIALLPRITTDLTEAEIKKLSFGNIAALSLSVTGFLGR